MNAPVIGRLSVSLSQSICISAVIAVVWISVPAIVVVVVVNEHFVVVVVVVVCIVLLLRVLRPGRRIVIVVSSYSCSYIYSCSLV